MQQSELLRRMILRLSLTFLLLVVSGCALINPEPPPPLVTTTPEPEPESAPSPPIEVPRVAEPAPTQEPQARPEPVSSQVAIVLSGSSPAYVDIASALITYLEDYNVYDLSDRNRSPRQAFAAIADSNAKLVVAIGLFAAKVAKSFATVPVIFSQVFNVNENELISDEIKGVAVLPPLELQVEAWREMDPDIRNIGAIIGEGHEDLIAEADRVMQERGIKFHYAVARSDREMLYQFKRLIRGLDGYLLFPDNRILSRKALTEIMSDAARHSVQVAVFNDSLLAHGATFSFNSVNTDIADKITIALNEILDGNINDVAPLGALTRIRIRTNPAMVQKYGLDVSNVTISAAVSDTQ